MIAYANAIAKCKGIKLPQGCGQDFSVCRTFLEQNAGSMD